jgi:hypothetical protein
MSLRKITIYGKPDCHLCNVAAEVVQKVVGSNIAVLIEKVDITDDIALLEKYKNDIPVIAVDGVDTFKHHVDPQQLARMFYGELGEKLVGF